MKRVERWRRIAHEAAQQSRRSDVPVIHDPVKLSDRVKAASTAKRIVLAEQERSTTLRGASRKRLPQPVLRCRLWKLRSVRKADGRRTKKRSSMRMDGRLCRWGRAFCARRRRRSRRWRWWLRCWSKKAACGVRSFPPHDFVRTGAPREYLNLLERDAALPGDEVVLAELLSLGEALAAGHINDTGREADRRIGGSSIRR